MKKLLAVLLTLAMALTLMGGIAAAADDEVINLRLFHRGWPGTDLPMIEEALSDYTRDAMGVTIELIVIGAEYTSRIPLMLASDEQMDIGFDANWLDYFGRSRAGAYLDITDMLDDVPLLKETIGPVMWDGSKVDGRIYGVPTKKEYATQWALMVEEEFITTHNLDISGIKTVPDAEFILEALSKDPDRPGFMFTMGGYGGVMLMNLENYFYGSSFDPSYVSVMKIGQEGTFVNYYETPEFKEYCETLHRWYELGYIDPNIATLENYDKYTRDSQNYGLGLIGYSPQTEINTSIGYGKSIVPIKVTPIMLRDGGVVGSINCIFAKTQYPEVVLQFMQLWNTDPVVKNFLVYGIEGEHYELIDGKVRWLPDAASRTAGIGNWTSGNMYISYLLESDQDDKYEQYDQFNADALISPLVGFQPNTDAIVDKIAALNGVVAEYVPLLICGAINPDEYIPILTDALKAAGADDVIAEMQRQYDEFVAG